MIQFLITAALEVLVQIVVILGIYSIVQFVLNMTRRKEQGQRVEVALGGYNPNVKESYQYLRSNSLNKMTEELNHLMEQSAHIEVVGFNATKLGEEIHFSCLYKRTVIAEELPNQRKVE